MYESAKIKLTHNPSGLEKGWMEIRLNYWINLNKILINFKPN